VSDFANAFPTKTFFLDMLTRDISLEDAILDLVDNCIDSLARTRNLPLNESLLDAKQSAKRAEKFRELGIPQIKIKFDVDGFSIEDNCGGIEYEAAKDDVFRFGRVNDSKKSRLSVYGIGLKRALFKLGKQIEVRSATTHTGFKVSINADKWAQEEEWHFPLEEGQPARSANSAGTRINVTRLTPEVRARIEDGQMPTKLYDSIAAAYALLLGRFVSVTLNGTKVAPKQIPLGTSNSVRPANENFKIGEVNVSLVTSLAERMEGEWSLDRAGWYVFCNGRVVVFADKTELTGWGLNSPQFVSKYRGFVGIAFFFSDNPEALPWTTTKRGLNRESRAFVAARNKMAVLARPVLTFLNNMYSSGEPEEPLERTVASGVRAASVESVIKSAKSTFSVSMPVRKEASYVSIQFRAKKTDLARIKKHISEPTWSASKVGEHVFQYFLERECGV
jgi:hypothetical protein